MRIYYLPCPMCSKAKIELDTDDDSAVRCDSCGARFKWRWIGKGSLALFQRSKAPIHAYYGVGRYQDEYYEDEDEDEDEDDDEDDWDDDDEDEDEDEDDDDY